MPDESVILYKTL